MKNKINPKKLLHSKWTAVSPLNKEKHFMISEVVFDEEGLLVLSCTLEAVMSKQVYHITWQDLTNATDWHQGWR